MRVPLAAVLLIATFSLAGCVGGDDDPAPAAPGATSSSASGSGNSPAASAGTGSGSGSGANPSPNNTLEPPMGDPEVTNRNGNFIVKAHPPLGPPLMAGNTSDQFRLSFDASNGYIMIIEWTASSPLTNEMGIWARKNPGDGHAFHASGTSPVRLVMPGAESSGGSYLVDVLPTASPRAGVNQGFTITLASFVGVPFNPEWQPV